MSLTMNIDPTKVREAAQRGIPLVIHTSLLPPQTEADLEEILGIFLEELGRGDVAHHLAYCLRELTGNAKKANTKRAYFIDRGVDIRDPHAYAKAMETFKKDTLQDIDRYLALAESKGLEIKITFVVRDQVLQIQVANNTPLLPAELERVDERIALARSYTTMDEAFEDVLDDSEGAGLGLTILLLMLRRMGLSEHSFRLRTDGKDTVASLRIPAAEVHREQITTLADELVAAVASLPPFPDNLRQLMRLLDQPDVTFEALATQLSRDPALTSDLIRYINSAGKGRRARVTNLRDAVQLVGLEGIREMVVPYGAQKLLEKFISQQRVLWTEAEKISALALEMGKTLNFERQERDLVQIGGLLSSLGRIVVAVLHPDLDQRIRKFCRAKKISPERFNELTQVINPAELGARVAEKWAFPTNLIEVLRHQGFPEDVGPELRRPVGVVHVAVWLVSRGLEGDRREPLDQALVAELGFTDPKQVEALHRKVELAYS